MLKLIQGYYHFLALGKFMEGVILSNDLSSLAVEYPIKTGETSTFLLKDNLISSLLSSIHKHPDKRNIYGYLTEISAFKGIFSTMRELIENNSAFRTFLQTQLQDQYFPFEQLIRFLRNVLNHATTGNLAIKLEDYDIQKDYILSPKVQRTQALKGSAKIAFHFLYAHYIQQRSGSPEYGIQISMDFWTLKPGMKLEELISWHNLYLLAELCFNLAQIAQFRLNTSKNSSSKKETKKSDTPLHAPKPARKNTAARLLRETKK